MSSRPRRLGWPAILCIFSATSAVAQTLSDSTINNVRARMNQSATKSWEMGTATEALLELDFASNSVFGSSPSFTTSSVPSGGSSALEPVLQFPRTALKQRNGSKMIIEDGAAADPASLGVSCILGNLTGADTNVSNLTFLKAASDELDYLLNDTPRNSDGAISHRADQVQLWADFVYMVPPFLAYYGVVTGNKTLVQQAVTQISLYRNHLKDSNNLWRHIALGNGAQDGGYWATGNAWAAAGIVRVLATIKNSPMASDLKKEQSNLKDWATEIYTAFYKYQDNSTALNRNYVNQSDSFFDAAGSVLMAASVYRLAVLTETYHSIPNAEKLRLAISSPTNGSATRNIDSNGWLHPVVNPLSFASEGEQSPEGQAFVLMLHAAYNDWQSQGSKGQNGASARLGHGVIGALVGGMFIAFLGVSYVV